MSNSCLLTRAVSTHPRPFPCTGAYGQGPWLNSQPAGDHTGMSVNMFKQVGDKLDVVNVMSYGQCD